MVLLLMMFDIQGNCFCESSGSGFGKAKVLYCYGEVRMMMMRIIMITSMILMIDGDDNFMILLLAKVL